MFEFSFEPWLYYTKYWVAFKSEFGIVRYFCPGCTIYILVEIINSTQMHRSHWHRVSVLRNYLNAYESFLSFIAVTQCAKICERAVI